MLLALGVADLGCSGDSPRNPKQPVCSLRGVLVVVPDRSQAGPSTSEVAMLHITSAMMPSSSFHASGFLNTPSSIRAP